MPESNTLPVCFEDQEIRTFINEDHTIWFAAKDVCNALEITWSGATLNKIPENWRGMLKLNIPLHNQHDICGTQEQEVVFISEPALYKLAFRSNKPKAEKFTNWVASEVLPEIRSKGFYIPENKDPEQEYYKAITRKVEMQMKDICQIIETFQK